MCKKKFGHMSCMSNVMFLWQKLKLNINHFENLNLLRGLFCVKFDDNIFFYYYGLIFFSFNFVLYQLTNVIYDMHVTLAIHL